MPLADGQIFADYTIGRVLGTGGMGEVYLAQHPRLPRHDALKVLGTGVSHDEEYRQRFNREAEMVAMLRHPNIVTIYDRGDLEGQLWIAMEFVDGTDASRLLIDKYPNGIPPAEVAHIVTDIADALDYAHSRGLLHRDIKPANILLGVSESGDERVMLTDFGVARWIGQSSDLTGADMHDVDAAIADLADVAGRHLSGPLAEMRMGALFGELLSSANRHGMSLPTNHVLLFKQLLYLDGLCRRLNPGFDVFRDGGRYVPYFAPEAGGAPCDASVVPTGSREQDGTARPGSDDDHDGGHA